MLLYLDYVWNCNNKEKLKIEVTVYYTFDEGKKQTLSFFDRKFSACPTGCYLSSIRNTVCRAKTASTLQQDYRPRVPVCAYIGKHLI